MVQPDKERQLDDVILNVFEQSSCGDRHFYFPVTSQNDARAFVHELHTRGVQYSRICATVGELEQNFTAWRTGLSRPVIGNRVVERINRPLQQLLLAADDQDGEGDVKFSDVDDDDDVLTQFSSSLPVSTPAKPSKKIRRRTSPRASGARKVTAQSRDDRTADGTSQSTAATTTEHHSITGDTVDHVDSSAASFVGTDVQLASDVGQPTAGVVLMKNDDDEDNNNNNNNNNKSPPLTADVREDRADDRGVTDGEHISRSETPFSSGEVDGQDEAAGAEKIEKPEVSGADDSEVTRRSQTQRRDSWVTELSVNLSTDSETSSKPRQITVTSAAAAAATTTTQHLCSQTDMVVNSAVADTATINTTENSDSNSSSTLHLGSTDTDTPEVNGHVTSQPEILTNDSVTISPATNSWSSGDCTAAPSHLVASDLRSPEVNGHVTSQPETHTTADTVVNHSAESEVVAVLDQQTTPSDDLITDSVDMTSSTEEVAATARPEVTSQVTSSSSEVTSEPERKCVLRERSRKKDGDRDFDDVDESYNSDDDEDDASGSSYLERRAGHRGKRWGRRFQHDGPGYVYVFTDTAADCSTQCRVKISASRRPEARLRQAQLFNVDVRLVTAVKVSSRMAAACLLRQKLADNAIPETLDWFVTPLDMVVNGVMDVSKLYSPLADILDDQM